MPYLTSIERMGREEGRVEALREDVIEALEVRFGQVPLSVHQHVTHSGDAAQLKARHRLAVRYADVAEFERALQP